MHIKVKNLITGIFLICIVARSYGQTSGISINFKDTELYIVLDKVEQETGFFFLFNEKLVNTKQKISINVINESLSNLLQILFRDMDIRYTIINDKIILAPENLLPLKNHVLVTGYVKDENQEPLAGVNIQIEGTSSGTASDSDGRFALNINNQDQSLIFSYIGYNQQRIAVNGRTSFNVTMVPLVASINEVVVIGYGSARKSDLTGSVTAINLNAYESQPVTRVDEILQGRSPGVNVTTVSGAPGGTTSIRIRGSNSITGSNEPLYVIDGFVGDNMANVNPADIASIQVLKDASSTAIYGSRGANGVIIITTRKGAAGKQRFSVSSRYITSKPAKLWPLLNAGEFARVCNDKADALGYVHPFTNDQVSDFIKNGGTDWQDLIYRTAGGTEFLMDYSGGNEILTFYVSANHLNQEGIIINSDFKRYSLKANIDANINERFKASLKVNFTRRETNNTSGNYNTNSVVASSTAWAPTTPLYDSNGNLTVVDPVCSIKTNPVELATNDDINETNSFTTYSNFDYRIMKELSLNIGFGASYTNNQNKSFIQRLITNNPSAVRSTDESIFLQNTNMLTYTKNFNNRHDIIITGVAEYQLQQDEYFGSVSNNLLFPFLGYENINLAKTYSLSNGLAKSTIGSYIGRINYTYLDRYLLTFSVRSDRSSKFRGANQTSVFPSVGLGWRISEEEFMKNNPLVSNLKLRASWGQTGSQAIDVYGTVTAYNTGVNEASTSWLNGTLTPGINIGDPGNKDLRWETTTQSDVGIDLGILKDRITVEADYFHKNTSDLLLSEPLPGYVGGGSIFRNEGSVHNSGIEINLNARMVEKRSFSWNFNFNISLLDNKVKNLGKNPYIVKQGGAGAGMVSFPEMILKPGYSISSYYGFKSLGIWQVADAELAARYGQKPGDYRYEDLNGDFAFTGADFQIIGSGIPKKVLGLNNTFSFKNFTLNAFLQSMLDYDKWNFAYAQIMIAAADAREYTHRDILNRWSPDNPGSRVAAFSKTNVPRIQSSEYIESGNYLRLKNISLRYSLPKETFSWGTISAQISAQNLWTLTEYKGLDPETYSNIGSGDSRGGDGGSYPNARTWSFELNLSF